MPELNPKPSFKEEKDLREPRSESKAFSGGIAEEHLDEAMEMILQETTDTPQANGKPVMSRVRRFFRATSVFFLVLFAVTELLTISNAYLKNRILWNTRIGAFDVGGLTIDEARTVLTKHLDNYGKQQFTLHSGDNRWPVRVASFGVNFEVESALMKAFAIGHENNFARNQLERLKALFRINDVPLAHELNASRVREVVVEHVDMLANHRPVDAWVEFENGYFRTTPAAPGVDFDLATLLDQLETCVGEVKTGSIEINIFDKTPDITDDEALKALYRANWLANRRVTFTYTYDGFNIDKWPVYLGYWKKSIRFTKVDNGEGEIYLAPIIDPDVVTNYLNTEIAPYMYVPKEDTRIFLDEYDRLRVEGLAKDGYALDVPKTVKAFNDSLIAGKLEVVLEVIYLIGTIADPENAAGYRDLLATGVTDFYGSSKTRIFNIGHGAKRFQNLVIHPGKTFSFLRYLGEVDSTTGYAKEMVIVEGDSSTPDYGGGICQISSTIFRTVFFAGLEIVNRVNHSYAVKYYKPLGLDATIFIPSPDLRFKNDTEHPILIQNYLDEKRTKLYFKVFGVKDGRKVRFEGPIDHGDLTDDTTRFRVEWKRYIKFANAEKEDWESYRSVYKKEEFVKQYDYEAELKKKAEMARLDSIAAELAKLTGVDDSTAISDSLTLDSKKVKAEPAVADTLKSAKQDSTSEGAMGLIDKAGSLEPKKPEAPKKDWP